VRDERGANELGWDNMLAIEEHAVVQALSAEVAKSSGVKASEVFRSA